MTEGNEAAPAEQASEAVEQTAVESIQQEKPSIMLDKDAATDMASKATDVNNIESGDPVEQGLNKGMKISGVAGELVADKVENDVSPVADVPADAQLNAEESEEEPSAPSNQEEGESEPEKEEETESEPKKEEAEKEPEEEKEEESEPEKEEETPEDAEKEVEPEKEEETEEEAEKEPEEENKDQEESETPEAAQPEGEAEEQAETDEYTPFGDPLRNVVENMSQQEKVPIDRKTTADSDILLTDVPGKLRIY